MPEPIQATQALRDDHKILKGLFRQFEAVGRPVREIKTRLVQEIFAMLESHFEIEERIFYPAVAAAADEPVRGFVERGLAEHRRMGGFIRLLSRMDIHGEFFDARFSGLINEMMDHMGEEERELFPAAESLLATRLLQLGEQMMLLKEERFQVIQGIRSRSA